MTKLGLCGGIGSGKSTVAMVFETLGYPVYYSDPAAKRLMTGSLRGDIETLLGKNCFFPSGELNRQYVSSMVFENETLLERLNSLVHPAVEEDFKEWAKSQENPIILQESALLIESKAYLQLDKVIMVKAPLEIRIKRTVKRDNLSTNQVISRIKNQLNEDELIKHCDFVIDTQNQFIIKQVLDIIKILLPLSQNK